MAFALRIFSVFVLNITRTLIENLLLSLSNRKKTKLIIFPREVSGSSAKQYSNVCIMHNILLVLSLSFCIFRRILSIRKKCMRQMAKTDISVYQLCMHNDIVNREYLWSTFRPKAFMLCKKMENGMYLCSCVFPCFLPSFSAFFQVLFFNKQTF